MMYGKRLVVGWTLLFATLLLCLAPPASLARDVTLVPSITLRGEYDDNVTYRRTDEIDDYLGIVSPAFTLDYATELIDLEATAIVDVLRYADESDLNTENQIYRLNVGYQFAERWNTLGRFSYIKDTTLDSELEETGIVYFRQDRERLNAGAGLSYRLSEVSDIGVNYAYSRTNYEEEVLEDYNVNYVSAVYSRRFNEGLDILSITPRYSHGESDASKVDGYRLTVGWTHLPSETYRLQVSLGARYTVEDFEYDRDTAENWGGLADINLRKSGEVYSARVGFNSDVYYDAGRRGMIQVFKLYGDYNRRILERLQAGINGRVSLTIPDDEDAGRDENIWYFTVSPFLSYRLTEKHSLRLGYTYQQQYDENFDDDERNVRNRVWISLNFNFPYKW